MAALSRLGALSLVLLAQVACVDSASPVVPAQGGPSGDPGRAPPLPSLIVAAGPPNAPVARPFLRCEGTSLRSGDSMFCYDETPRTWQQAEEHCQSIGGHLADVANAAEAKALRDVFGAPFDLPPEVLIGLVEPLREGEWGWLSGKRTTHESWLPGEPNDSGGEDCGEMDIASGKWNDIDCRTGMPFLCEGSPVPPGGKATLKCAGALIQAGQIPYCVHADQALAVAQAEQACKATGGHLAELSTAEKERAFLAATRPAVGGGSHAWLGITDARKEGDFRTARGGIPTFTGWRAGEPNNAGEEDCAIWGPTDGRWNDVPCDLQAPSLCRGDADPAPQACDGPLPFTSAGCTNVASPAPPTSASAIWQTNGPEKAVNGDCATGWNAGGAPQQHWQVDLGSVQDIRGITVSPGMSPKTASVAHDVAVSVDGAVFRVVLRYDGSMTHGQVYPLDFGAPARARYVRVTTTASPSWVAWQEIAIFHCP